MIHTGTSRVEEHGDRANELRQEDGQDGLPPIEPDADHRRPERPVAERQIPVKDHVVPPSCVYRRSALSFAAAAERCVY